MGSEDAGRVALVTGAGSGIGAAIAERLALDGFRVVLAANAHVASAETIAARLDRSAARTLVFTGDLTLEETPAALAAAVRARFGRLDCLVNNAGFGAETRMGSLDRVGLGRTVAVNLIAPLRLVDACLPLFDRGGSVTNISSLNSRRPPPGYAGYAASKAALEAATRTLAMELGEHRIRVNAILPGAVERADAPRPDELRAEILASTPMGAFVTPEDIAALAAFLASDQARAISGECIAVTGGAGL